jgi:two-component system, NarL family, nitrate/nitrite response regulator NarL
MTLTQADSIDVLVVDDHPLLRDSLITSIRTQLRLGAHGVGTASEARAVLERGDIRMMVLDLRLTDSTVSDTLQWLTRLSVPTLVISGTDSLTDAKAALACGAAGFVPKVADAQEMLQAVQTVLEGGQVIPSEWMDAHRSNETDRRILSQQIKLTNRQYAVLRELARGSANKDIARDLDMAEKTVKVHLGAIFKALGVSNRTQAAIKAQRMLQARTGSDIGAA